MPFYFLEEQKDLIGNINEWTTQKILPLYATVWWT